MQQVDILLPLGTGSRHDNLELRYCLRSIEKHLKNVRKIFIVGEFPDWINDSREDIIYLPCKDNTAGTQRAHNIYRKIMAGCEYSGMSDNFLFMNDDHFLFKDFEASEFPFYHRGPIEPNRIGNEAQRVQMENTVMALLSQYEETNDYDVHAPMLFNKDRFQYAFSGLEWQDYGFGIKSIYGNIWAKESVLIEDLKFSEAAMKESIYRALEGREFFSIGDKVLRGGGMQMVLHELYPEKSKYEV